MSHPLMSHSYFLDHSVHLKETVPLKQRMKAYFDIDRCLVNFKISKRKYQLYLLYGLILIWYLWSPEDCPLRILRSGAPTLNAEAHNLARWPTLCGDSQTSGKDGHFPRMALSSRSKSENWVPAPASHEHSCSSFSSHEWAAHVCHKHPCAK